MENKNKLTTILTLIFIAISIGLYVYVLVKKDSSKSITDGSPGNKLKAESKKAGAVEVSATPLITNSSYEFDISLNTHSIELNYDLAALSILTNDKGLSLKPIKWEGDAPEGHHRNGKLIFSTFSKKPKTLNLTISNIDGQDINFKWEL